MSTTQKLHKTHKTRIQNCKGSLIGDRNDLSQNCFVYWCPVKMIWVTRKSLVNVDKHLMYASEFTI